jgi:hypothetical protein
MNSGPLGQRTGTYSSADPDAATVMYAPSGVRPRATESESR